MCSCYIFFCSTKWNNNTAYFFSLSCNTPIHAYQQAYANVNARVDVEGCCWWARGVLKSKGTCTFGRLNYYLGKRAADEGRPSLFPGMTSYAFSSFVSSTQHYFALYFSTMIWFHPWQFHAQPRCGFLHQSRSSVW